MKSVWKWFAGALVLALLIVGARFAYDYLSENYKPEALQTQPADTQGTDGQATELPDFTVYDGEGNPVKLSDMRGKPVVVNLWATWCTYCKQEMPDFETVFKTYGQDVHFMMVNVTDGVQETLEKAQAHIADNGFTFPVYYDTELSASNVFGTSSLPATFFFDKDGVPVTYAMGMIDAATLEKGIEAIMPE